MQIGNVGFNPSMPEGEPKKETNEANYVNSVWNIDEKGEVTKDDVTRYFARFIGNTYGEEFAYKNKKMLYDKCNDLLKTCMKSGKFVENLANEWINKFAEENKNVKVEQNTEDVNFNSDIAKKITSMTIETPEDFIYEFDEQGELSVNKRISPIGTSWVQKPADGRAINSYNYGEQLITKIAVYQDLAKKEEPLSTFEQNFVKQLEANVTLAIEEGILK